MRSCDYLQNAVDKMSIAIDCNDDKIERLKFDDDDDDDDDQTCSK